MCKKTNEVVEETSGSGYKGGLARGVPRNRRGGERKGENKVEIVLVQASVPLGKVGILPGEQCAFLIDGSAQSKPIKETRPIVVSASRRGVVSEHPGHSPPDEAGKTLEEVADGHSLVDRLPLAQWLEGRCCDSIQRVVSRDQIGLGNSTHIQRKRRFEAPNGCRPKGSEGDYAAINTRFPIW